MPGINFLSKADSLVRLWNRPASQLRTPTGRGDSGPGARIYPRHHPGFRAALERGVRPLVIALIDSLDCITYSSCEGHPSDARKAFEPVHVGMLSRSRKEHVELQGQLHRITAWANREARQSGVYVTVLQGRLDTDAGSRRCLDLVLAPTTDEASYFRAVPDCIRRLTSLVRSDAEGTLNVGTSLDYAGVARIADPGVSRELAAQYRNGVPYPHLWFSNLLTAAEARTVRDAIPPDAWARVDRTAYQFDVVDLLRMPFRRRTPFADLVTALSSGPVTNAFSLFSGCPALKLDAVHVHRMSSGQSVSVHTDGARHPSAVRLIVYLENRRSDQGGVHLLLRERKRDFLVAQQYAPRAAHALLFPMGGSAYHAVTTIAGKGRRHTLVATYVSAP